MVTAIELLTEARTRANSTAEVGNYSVVLMLERDPLLARLVAAWPNVFIPPDPNPQEPCPPETPPGHRFRWLFARIEPDPIPEWIAASGLPDAPHVRRACQVAIVNRMVLPDGTLAMVIRNYVNALVAGAVRANMPEPPRRREQAPVPPPTSPQGGANGRG
jgi:hypothetical protein